jgi:hypothetical protein
LGTTLRGEADKSTGTGGEPPTPNSAPALTPAISAIEVRSRVRSAAAPGATQAIAAHFRYIGRQGKAEVGSKGKTLEIEDERGDKIQGRDGLVQLTDEWRVAGAHISEHSPRRATRALVSAC